MSLNFGGSSRAVLPKCVFAVALCMGLSSCSAEDSNKVAGHEADQSKAAAVSVAAGAEAVVTQSPSMDSQKPATPEMSERENATVLAASDQPRFVEGKHYRVLEGVPKYEATDKVTVQEFFSYGCPHCFRMEPVLAQWHAHEAMSFERVPATWNPFFKQLAFAFYTMQILGVENKLHAEIFNAIHVRREALKSKPELQALFEKAGVSAEDFNKTFDSFAVQQKVNTAEKMFQSFHLDHVPVFVIGSEYVTDVSMAGSPQAVTEVIDYLVRKMKIDAKS